MPEADFFGRAVVAGLVLLALVALYAGVVYQRLDGDEGGYLVAADLVRSGKIPYRDFFFPQMPLLPYLHALGVQILGQEVWAGRVVSGMLALGTAGAIGVGCYTVSRRRFLSIACGSLVLLSHYFLANSVIVKHYAPTSFFLALAFASILLGLSRARVRGSWRWFFVAGLGMGGAAAVRLPIWLPAIVVGLLVPVWAGRQAQMDLRVSGRRVADRLNRNLMPYAAGLAVPTLFTAAIAFSDVSAFLFGVVRYNSVAFDDLTFDVVLGLGKIQPIAALLLDPQILILLLGSIASIAPGSAHRPENKRAPPNLASFQLEQAVRIAGLFALLVFAYHLPAPKWLHPQYFNVAMPFLVFMTVMLLKNHPLRFPSASGGSPIVTVGLTLYVGFFLTAQLLPNWTAGRLTPGGAISVQSNAPLRTLLAGGATGWQGSKAIARGVCGLTTPDTRVAAEPMIVFLSGRSYVEGFEMGQGWSFVSEDKFEMTVSEMERYHVLGRSALVERMDGISIGLTGGWLLNDPRVDQAAEESGLYRLLGSRASHVYLSRQVATNPDRGKDCGVPVPALAPEPRVLRPPESLPIREELLEIWDDLYERRAAVLGPEATVLPFGDPRYGDPESPVFSGSGGKPLEFTWTMPPSAFDTPFEPGNLSSFQGVVPIFVLNGADEWAQGADDDYWTQVSEGIDQPFSVGAWLLVPVETETGGILSKWFNDKEWRLLLDGHQRVLFDLKGGEGAEAGVMGPPLTGEEWHFVIVTYDGRTVSQASSGIAIYYDGAEVSPISRTAAETYKSMRNTADIVELGQSQGLSPFAGAIAGGPLGPFFAPRRLSGEEIIALFEMDSRAMGFDAAE